MCVKGLLVCVCVCMLVCVCVCVKTIKGAIGAVADLGAGVTSLNHEPLDNAVERLCVCIYACIYIYIYIYMYVCICMYIYAGSPP